MNARSYFIAVDGLTWHVCSCNSGQVQSVAISLTEPVDLTAAAQESVKALRQWGWRAQAICLGLSSQMIYATPIDCTQLPRKGRRQAMHYQLEEQLPIDSERLTADYISNDAGLALAVAVETQRVAEIVAALAAAGVHVGSIRSSALLAAWQVRQTAQDADMILVAGEQDWDVLSFSADGPHSWDTASANPANIVRAVQAQMLLTPRPSPLKALLLGAGDEETCGVIEQDVPLHWLHAPASTVIELAANGARAALTGKNGGWAEFCRGSLAGGLSGETGKLLKASAVLAAVVLIALTAGLVWRGLRYQGLAQQLRHEQAQAFSAVHPDVPVPRSIRSHLASEVARLDAISGGQALPKQASALENLRLLAQAMPPDLRLKVSELFLGPTALTIKGQAHQHSDPEVLSQALHCLGYTVEAPQTDSAAGVVTFTLTGKPPDPCAASPSESVSAR